MKGGWAGRGGNRERESEDPDREIAPEDDSLQTSKQTANTGLDTDWTPMAV
jgi:hypothetical protein